MNEKKTSLTTAAGCPVVDNQNVMTAGPRGPQLLQDVWFLEKLAHFDREVIPERRMHAKGSGAYGTFTVTHDISPYTRAKIFSQVGKKTDVFVRFSTVAGERGAADGCVHGGQPLGEPVVDLDRRDARARLEDREGERPETGADLDDMIGCRDLGHVHDLAHGVRIDDEVLAELLGRGDLELGGEGADLGRAEQGHGHASSVPTDTQQFVT